MKIDIIDPEIETPSLLRIYDLTDEDVRTLIESFEKLAACTEGADSSLSSTVRNDLNYGEPLVLKIDDQASIFHSSDSLIWRMPVSGWINALELCKEFVPLSEARDRFQWLADEVVGEDGAEFSVLLSESRQGQW